MLARVDLPAAVGVLFHASKCEVGVRFTGRDNTLFDRAFWLLLTAFGYLFRVSEAEIHYLLTTNISMTSLFCAQSCTAHRMEIFAQLF